MAIFYDACVAQPKKMLENLERWLDTAEAHAKERSFDVEVLVSSRLAPDQYSLVRQIQGACDAAKFAAARVAGKDAPVHPDDEQTLPQIRQRIRTVIGYLESFEPRDFSGAETRRFSLPFLEGRMITASDYANEMALPNFYFHVTTAYAILRHNGVPLGKRDYIGSLRLIES